MPPPPPPSKSYLIKIVDTDSESDDDDDHHGRPTVIMPDEVERIQRLYDNDPPELETEDEQFIEPVEENKDDVDEEMLTRNSKCVHSDSSISANAPPMTKSQKNNKRKRNKKKQKKKKNKNSNSGFIKHVRFDNVLIHEFKRCLGDDVVPYDGGWPLGLDFDHLEFQETVSIDDYEAFKQKKLQERWNDVKAKISNEDVIDMMTKSIQASENSQFETRQWDYKSGVKNPLFGLLVEEARMNLLLESSNTEDENNSQSGKNNPSGGDQSPQGKRRSRSNSVSVHEVFNEAYPQIKVHHVRNELETLRNQRTMSGSTGCTCTKLSVYVLPEDGSQVGKKAHHRRMKPAKLKDELMKRKLYSPSLSRIEMEKLLHKAVEEEPCCWGQDCSCVANGLNCQADACSCWHDSHVHTKKKSGSNDVSAEGIEKRCGNVNGMYAIRLGEIDKYRDQVLMQCYPVSASG